MRSFFMILSIVALLTACGSNKNNGGGGVLEIPSPNNLSTPTNNNKKTQNVLKTPDDDKISLSISPTGFVTVKTDTGTATGYNQKDSFYGAWLDDSQQFSQLSYQGVEATNIPTTGTATYVGNVIRADADIGIYNAGRSKLDVNFGTKTVQGYLELDVARDITLRKGHLDGAKFSGQATVLGNSQGQYSGTLMGAGATEAAGLVKFENEPSLNSAFGGRRY